eukprot:COSAG02_NODE_2442_length_8854_cov_2.621359_3_plen_49_part_00
MQARLDEETGDTAGLSELRCAHELARRFYGEGAQVLLDIERCILEFPR